MANTERDARAKFLRIDAQKLLTSDYFAVLGVTRTATPDEVKKAFFEAAQIWHPDRVPSGCEDLRPLFTKVFARLEAARASLSDPARRARYIEELAKPATATSLADAVSSAEATLEFRKAEAFLKKNDTAQALTHLQRATQLAPGNVEFQSLLVWLQAKPDTPPARLRELVKDLDALITRDKTCERAYFNRGLLKKRLDLVDEAVADFERASELNPKNVDALREVRIHRMRQERSGTGPHPAMKGSPSSTSGGTGESGGALGFFKKLLKR